MEETWLSRQRACLASLAYNLATRNRDTLRYDGPSVVVDGTRLAYGRWGTRSRPGPRSRAASSAARIVLLDGDALPEGGDPTWLSALLVPPWFTSAYRLVTGSDFVFRRVLHAAGRRRAGRR